MRHSIVSTYRVLRLLGVCLIIGLVLVLGAAPVAALERRTDELATVAAGETIADDLLVTGNIVTIGGHITGDLYAFGNTVTLLPSARVDGDVITAANTVTIAGTIGGDVRTAGNMVTIDAAVARNVLAAGNQLTLGASSAIKGSVIGGSAVVTLLGAIDGRLTAGGGQVVLAGRVGQDAELWIDRLTVQPSARLDGRLVYTAPTEQAIPATLAPRAVQWLPAPQPAPTPTPTLTERLVEWLGGTVGLLGLLGTMLFGLVLVWLTPGLYRTTETTIRRQGLVALGIGLATLVLMPILAVVLLISVVGLPVGLLGLGSYFAGWYLGWLVAATALAGLAVGLVRNERPALATGWLVVIGLLGLHLLTRLPYLGGLLALLVLSLGLGTLTLAIAARLRRPAAASVTTPTPTTPIAPRPVWEG